ncbi:hypothetical protein DU478_13315 [Thalassococcus profundi]|uniref:DUF4157 domain-containing protein n=2 Tax=Thalassococcus profundi TaxID=2282382 RepID=A0A369TKU9_9RHOB|nr:hypothetical protein DU478_13315 [Thalassococcus profundi]
MRWVFLFLCLAACGRSLTGDEIAFAHALGGGEIDTARVRLVGDNPGGAITYTRPIRPRLTCSERIWPPSRGERVRVAPGGTVLFNTVMVRPDLFRDDFLEGYPDRVDLVDLMFFAHELTHVWQWQNRRKTGYHPLRALSEHSRSDDPYLFDPDSAARFEDFGYEQQGAIVEEYVCCHLLDPQAPRTTRLRDMIAQSMPLQRIERMLDPKVVRMPWAGAQPENICR